VKYMHRRLKKLEGIAGAGAPAKSPFRIIDESVCGKLSDAERDLLMEYERLPEAQRTEAHKTIWKRWETAVSDASLETHSAIVIAPIFWGV
jgi:hypothetical protein